MDIIAIFEQLDSQAKDLGRVTRLDVKPFRLTRVPRNDREVFTCDSEDRPPV